MLETMMVSSGSVMYVMAAVGILGVLAKIVNRMTLYRLIKAAGNMPKSTHKLMKLVKAKYEHACMAHESVENVGVFVEKYIYEYRGFFVSDTHMASDRAVVCLVCRYFSGDRRGAFLHGRRTYGNGLSVHSRRGGGSGASYGDHSYVGRAV